MRNSTDMEKKYNVIIVGAGPSGYMCAYELIKNKPDLKILVLDKGKSIEDRRCPVLEHKLDKCPQNKSGQCLPACSITNGFGGAGAYSDGKFNITTEYGGWLGEYIGDDKLIELINYVDSVNMEYGAPEECINPDSPEVKEIERKAIAVGMKLLKSKVRHIGTEVNLQILSKIYADLRRKVEFKFGEEVVDLVFEDGKLAGVSTLNETYKADTVVFGVGRAGSKKLCEMLEFYGVKMSQTQVDLGVRVECSNLVMEEINKNLYDGKFLFRTSGGNTVRTFCSNPGGQVVVENYDGVINVNGHAYKDEKLHSQNTNFSLLVSHHFTEPFKSPNEYAKKISSLANQLACGGVIVQRYGDILMGRRSTEKRIKEGFVKPTLKEAVPGDLTLCLPHRTMQAIIEMIEALDKVAPGIATEHTLLYGVEAKYYAARPDMNDKLEVKGIENLYMAGDGAGITRGLAQAGACGVYVARNILSKE